MKTKKILSINDLAGLGRVALYNFIAIVSSMGNQAIPVPSVVLSTHGAYKDVVVNKLTSHMMDSLKHYFQLGIDFEGIFVGFLGDEQQIDLISEFLPKNKKNELIVVDPIMADHSSVYKIFNLEYIKKMKKLVKLADIITPNLTEAYLLSLSDKELDEVDIYNIEIEEEPCNIAKKISLLGVKNIIITGVIINHQDLENGYVLYYNVEKEYFKRFNYQHLKVNYPGTGDIFSAIIVAGVLNGKSIAESIIQGIDFLYKSIKYTIECKTPALEGIQFEKFLNKLS